jgi:hypothetical protein
MPATLTIADWTGPAIFLIAWLLYEPFMEAAGRPGADQHRHDGDPTRLDEKFGRA